MKLPGTKYGENILSRNLNLKDRLYGTESSLVKKNEQEIVTLGQISKEKLTDLMMHFYQDQSPEKINDIPRIIEKYYEDQISLDRNMQIKYDLSLNDIALDLESSKKPEVDDDSQLVDYHCIYPPKSLRLKSKYKKILRAVEQNLNEKQLRLQAPLQHNRKDVVLPPIKGVEKIQDGESLKKLPISGPAQVAAATRLMNGDSTQSKNPIVLPSKPVFMPNQNKTVSGAAYGLAYRQRLDLRRHKPTVPITQVNFGSFIEFPQRFQ